ncbi:MAG: pyridoxal phosphate-dependent aminotransferase [Lachnospiraceae bacterium]|nr:pyridoxal phosphate-dependent aminotransferase [Lachnospiraceae bacterium]
MYSEMMYQYGSQKSVIREIFAYGQQKVRELGPDAVFDFSLGNPSIPSPESVTQALLEILQSEDPIRIHGYTAAQGDLSVRETLAASVNRRFGMDVGPDNFYITCGAAASLCCAIRALTNPGDEWLVFAPYFPEYKCFVEAAAGVVKEIPPRLPDFQADLEAFEKEITDKTKAVIVNSPNNPSGVVYSEETIQAITDILKKKEEEYGHPIFLVADEPYREIVYGDVTVPYLPKYYDDTLVCYSYSKSLSLPGERIGYILVPDQVTESKKIYSAVCGAGRALGFVCAPSLFQKVIEKCVDEVGDIEAYKENRDLLYGRLTELGYECVKPDGAFYLFVKTLESDANEFCKKAREKYNLLLVPSDSFGCTGYMRVSYCVSNEMIKRALPYFEKLKKDYEA